ncbi:hypothetical protein OAU50_02535 [Planctomycetota bacterium]|nr:hypothetical protein [Planctomycetota bacterium]
MTTATPHPFLAPLLGDFSSIVGETSTAIKAIRRHLEGGAKVRTLRVRPEYAVFEVSEFTVKAFRRGVMAKVSALKFSAAGREWATANEARKRSIPIATPVGVIATPEFTYYLSAKVPDAEYLQDVFRDETAVEVRGFAAFVAGLHDAGLVQESHPLKSILMTEGSQFFVGDLRREEFHDSLDETTRLEHIAYLSLCFPKVSAVMQRRFFRAYAKTALPNADEKSTVRKVLARSIAMQFELNTAKVSGCTTASTAIATAQRDGVQIAMFRQAESIEVRELEGVVAGAQGHEWEQLLREHFNLHVGHDRLWNIKCPIKHGGHAAVRRRIEATWGRLLELNAIQVQTPTPLAVLIEPELVRVFGSSVGPLQSLAKKRAHDDLELFEELSQQLIRMHRCGVFFLPIDAAELIKGLNFCRDEAARRMVVLTAPDHMFRGRPTTLGQQAVASLGRIGHTVMTYVGERQMKELVWGYARQLRLNQNDTDMLLKEAQRNPTGQTLVMTQGLERSNGDA